jgi:hypothetical protein
VLAFLSKIFNWHASRDDGFLSPVQRGMARTKFGESARSRVLSDDEIRSVWQPVTIAQIAKATGLGC